MTFARAVGPTEREREVRRPRARAERRRKGGGGDQGKREEERRQARRRPKKGGSREDGRSMRLGRRVVLAAGRRCGAKTPFSS